MLATTLLAVAFSAGAAFAQSPMWGQCGGVGWTGPTTCVAGAVCTYSNVDYSQCIPIPTTTTTPIPYPTGYKIRLLPLGDDITSGVIGTDFKNGYRDGLHFLLENGNDVDFIGSLKIGDIKDNDNEGHFGATIDQVATFAKNKAALPAKPNIVCLLAGTYDILGGKSRGAPDRLNKLIDQIFAAVPDTIVIVGTLTPLPSAQALVDTYNQALAFLVNDRAVAGQHILLAPMNKVLDSELVQDRIHPNDYGYAEMASAWYYAIRVASNKGWLAAR